MIYEEDYKNCMKYINKSEMSLCHDLKKVLCLFMLLFVLARSKATSFGLLSDMSSDLVKEPGKIQSEILHRRSFF